MVDAQCLTMRHTRAMTEIVTYTSKCLDCWPNSPALCLSDLDGVAEWQRQHHRTTGHTHHKVVKHVNRW